MTGRVTEGSAGRVVRVVDGRPRAVGSGVRLTVVGRVVVVLVVALGLALPGAAAGMPIGPLSAARVDTVGSAGVLHGGPVARVAGSCPSEVPAGECAVDPKTGCPTAGPISATPPLRCVPLSSDLPQVDMTVGTPPDTRCAANFFVRVKLRPGLVSYEAVWYSTFGEGTRWWSSPGTVWPGRILGIGAYYSVPKGYAAWSASYSDCGAPPPMTYGTAAWGIEARYEVSGRVTDNGAGAPQVTVHASCPSGGTTSTDLHGNYSFFLKRGHCTIAPVVPPTESPTPKQRHLFVNHDFHNQDFALHYLTIRGKATDADRKPIENAHVDISGPTSGHLRTLANGDYGPYKVKPGHYTVKTAFETSSRQRFAMHVTRCTPGTPSTKRCDATLHKRNLTADFKLPRPRLNITFNPKTVPGNGRGATNVTIRLTVDGQPVVGQDLTAVANVPEVLGGKAPSPPIFTSADQLFSYADINQRYPAIVACAGPDLLGEGPFPVREQKTNAHGELRFRVFVGTNDTQIINLASVGPQLRLTVTDILDRTSLPGLAQHSRILTLTGYRFAEAAPLPDGLRYLANHRPHPAPLTSNEQANQTALLNWLTEVSRSRRFSPFGPTEGSALGAAPDTFAIYFGVPKGTLADASTLALPAIGTAAAGAIFGSAPLSPSLPTVAQTDVAGFPDKPVFPWGQFLFYGLGIYPDPTTSDGRQLEGCAHDYLRTTQSQTPTAR